MKIKNILTTCITGIGIGMPITLICMTCLGGWNDVIKEFLVWLVASALFGVLSLLFTSAKLPLPLITAIHCIGCLGITCGACFINGYSDNLWNILIYVLPVFAVVYAGIYITTMIIAKIEAKKINEALQNKE